MPSLSSLQAPEQGFSVDLEETPRRLLIRVRGELDLVTAPVLTAALDRVAGADVDLDLTGVTFCDVVGATALERAVHRRGAGDRQLVLIGADRPLALLTAYGLFPDLRRWPTRASDGQSESIAGAVRQ